MESDYDTLTGSGDDTLLAGLSHLSIFILGVILPLIIFLLNRDKPRPYLTYQSLQALVWQLASFVLLIVFSCCWVLLYVGLFPVAILTDGGSGTAGATTGLMAALLFCFMGLFGIVLLGYYGVAVAGAVRAFQGKPFTYPLVGRWARRFMPAAPANPAT